MREHKHRETCVIVTLGIALLLSSTSRAEQFDEGQRQVIQACQNCIATRAREFEGRSDLDCANVATEALVQCASEQGIRLRIRVYDAAQGKYVVLRSSDYKSPKLFAIDLRRSLGAVNLFDPGARVTRPKSLESLDPGDLILYDLQHREAGYTGHTIVVLSNDKDAEKVRGIEGHTMGQPVEEKEQPYTYDEIRKKFLPAEPKPREWNWEEIVEFCPNKPQPARRRDSRQDMGVRSGTVGGIEACPMSAVWAAGSLGATLQYGSSLPDLDELLPATGPPETERFVYTPHQTLRGSIGNAVEASAVDFRVDVGSQRSTVAVVLLTKTSPDTYKHDYHVCARFKGFILEDLQPFAIADATADNGQPEPPHFWFCRVYDDHLRTIEATYLFTVFVNESRRKLIVDSRWIDKQYAPYWRGARGPQHDYVLNFQVWSSSEAYSRQLVRAILRRLGRLGASWEVTFANRQELTSPAVFVEAASLEARNDVVQLSVWNRLSTQRLAVFHGTKQSVRNGTDESFEYWRPLQPGRNLLQLRLGRIDNAVVHCEVDGFMDKVYVSVDEAHALPWAAGNVLAAAAKPATGRPQIKILWPPDNAKVRVLRDLLDMSPDDCRLAINGTVSGAPADSRVEVFVRTDQSYRQDPPTQRDGLWGARVYLSGQGAHNSHRIHARLIDRRGNELAQDTVERIVRIDEAAGGRPKL